mmetsp:Transcript_20939/g.58070  ORF Transcript_20939/g.58070 Transcript_20939/m.58070 type:complete len:205 (+) Transcript_20939:395-1009(+)
MGLPTRLPAAELTHEEPPPSRSPAWGPSSPRSLSTPSATGSVLRCCCSSLSCSCCSVRLFLADNTSVRETTMTARTTTPAAIATMRMVVLPLPLPGLDGGAGTSGAVLLATATATSCGPSAVSSVIASGCSRARVMRDTSAKDKPKRLGGARTATSTTTLPGLTRMRRICSCSTCRVAASQDMKARNSSCSVAMSRFSMASVIQ